MRFKCVSAVCLILVAASSLGLRGVRASISNNQPFTAVEMQITRFADLPIPNVWTRILAVSGDGQLIASLGQSQLPGRPVYHRTVWNLREKTKVGIDPVLKMLGVYQYHQPFYLNAGDWYVEGDHLTNCDGTPDDQVEGFDVYRTEPETEDPSNPGRTFTWKRWAAPRLGCFILREERLETDKHGKFVSSNIRTLTDVKIGEPDPSYFDTSLPEGYARATPEAWADGYINRMKEQRAEQEQ
jgi:hypothetical protein